MWQIYGLLLNSVACCLLHNIQYPGCLQIYVPIPRLAKCRDCLPYLRTLQFHSRRQFYHSDRNLIQIVAARVLTYDWENQRLSWSIAHHDPSSDWYDNTRRKCNFSFPWQNFLYLSGADRSNPLKTNIVLSVNYANLASVDHKLYFPIFRAFIWTVQPNEIVVESS